MKAYDRVQVELHSFLTLAVDVALWSASFAGQFTSEERAPATNRSLSGSFGELALQDVERRLLGYPACIPVTIPTGLFWLPSTL